jgi:hypothetical protein
MIDTTILTALLVGGFGLGGTWLGGYMNRKTAIDTAHQLVEVERHKHAQSRLWDAKKDAYTDIVAQFNAIDNAITSMVERLFDAEINPSYYLESDEYNKDITAIWQRIWKLNNSLDNNRLVISDEFQAEISEWNIEFVDYDGRDAPREMITVQSEATKKYIPIIVKVAKAELEAAPKD